jgi:hypothetical protein
MLETARPGLTLAVAFIGVLFGMRLRRTRLALLGATGALAVLLEAGGTLALVGFGLPRVLDSAPPAVAVWGTALVAAPSTKSIFSWARTRLQAHGPVTDWLESITRHDDILALAALAALVSIIAPPSLAAPLAAHRGAAALACVALGLVTGGAYALLGGRSPDRDTAWVLLTGLTLLVAGLATRLGLPTLVVGFVLGGTIAATSREHALLDQIDAQTEQPLVLLLLMLVGMQLTLAGTGPLVATAVALRFLGKLVTGGAVGALRAGGVAASAGLFGFGGVGIAIAAQVYLLYGDAAGPILTIAAALAVAGDLTTALTLPSLLRRAGEVA